MALTLLTSHFAGFRQVLCGPLSESHGTPGAVSSAAQVSQCIISPPDLGSPEEAALGPSNQISMLTLSKISDYVPE